MARTSAVERYGLIDELFSLTTTTLVVPSPNDRSIPTMQRMLEDLHLNYRDAVGQPSSATFADIRDSTTDQRQAHPVESRRLERISDYGDALHTIVTSAASSADGQGLAVDERKLTPTQAATIAKAWELALDPIDISTAVWLDDGDVVTQMFSHANNASTNALLAFQGNLVGLGMRSWTQLVRLIAQLAATVTSAILTRVRTGIKRPRIARPTPRRKRSAEPRQLVLSRAHAIFGTGGKLFVTDAPDGSGGGIRTLVQVTGDIVTRATEGSLQDPDLLEQHQAKIDAWFAQLSRDWRRARTALGSSAVALTGVLLASDVTTFSQASDWRLLLLALPLVPPLLGKGLAIAARRFVLHASKGPKALLPARSDELSRRG